MKKWSLNSWKNFPAKHLPEYPDQKELDLVLGKIKNYPPFSILKDYVFALSD